MKQVFLLDTVLIFCVLLALASAQRANNVKATYQSYNAQKIQWNLNTSGVFCAAQDGNKSLSWRSEYGWTAFCGPVGPVGTAACGKCLNVTNKENGNMVSKTVRIVDTCTNGGLELDIDVFQKLDSSGTRNPQGYLMVDYEFVDCDCYTKGGNCGYISTETRRLTIDVSSKNKKSYTTVSTKSSYLKKTQSSRTANYCHNRTSTCISSPQLRHPPPPPPTLPAHLPPPPPTPPTIISPTPLSTRPKAPPPTPPLPSTPPAPPPLTQTQKPTFISPSPLSTRPKVAPKQTPTFLSPSPLSNSTLQFHRTTTGSDNNWKRTVAIGFGSATIVALLVYIIICYIRGKLLIQRVKLRFRAKNDKNIEAFLKDHKALLQKRYKFSEIKRMTNSFKVKLGQGGFGVVYKGELLNGCLVAVKILNASKRNGEEFINEVASITRTSHVNVVTLLGFCYEGHKKALVYEFMSNGSLDKFIYNKGSETIASLSWDSLHQIAKGIARGLEYLHRGCTTRILHFDIKPHNILLDENFCPKISDFGLAKLCLRKESIVSMSDQRGTMGYVAPEVWNRHFGGVSYKSDVYSYGMMLLEMVGGRKNVNVDASHTSEIYFPHWVYSRLELGGDLRSEGIMDTEEDEIARRMTIVGLWCIQTFPKDRPTMSKVIEMLEVSMNSLEIPPKPLHSSPTRSVSNSFTS